MAQSSTPEGAAAAQDDRAVSTPPHVVITAHGIRTFGNWQMHLTQLLGQAEPGIKVLNYTCGYFSALAFLVPPLRWLEGRRFRKFFVRQVKAAGEGARIDLVAHSFGTYLAASALGSIPKGRKVDTIIFAGSVLRPSFPWYKYQENQSVHRVVNDCGWDDTILLICQFSALMMGMAGRVGFRGMVGEHFVNRYFRFGHGGYFDSGHEFMRRKWLPLLTSNAAVEPFDERPALTTWGGMKLFLWNNLQFFKLAVAALLLLALVMIPLDWARNARFKKRVERLDHIARLANAVQIPGRDPNHVRDLLRVDVRHEPDDESKISHVVSAEVAPEGDEESFTAGDNDEEAEGWLEWIPGFRDSTRESSRARQLHARANFQIAAGKSGRTRDPSKARLLYEEAIRSYKRINDDDPAHGSYALCLMDYGLLLREMGLAKLAIDQFRAIRNEVFPRDANGERPTMPRSLVVDSLCAEAASLQDIEQWDEAAKCLWKAREHASGQDALLSLVDNDLAWLWMQRLDITNAKEFFTKAKESCEKLVDQGQIVYKARLFHIRHGLAMSQRLCGQWEDSYNQYDQLVKELQDLMRKDFDFQPKERRDLSVRLVNSMERRADVWFFSRKPSDGGAVVEASAASPKTESENDDRDLFKRIEHDYGEAVSQVGNDDLSTKTRLLYKKVITHLWGGKRSSSVSAGPADETEDGLSAVDAEFAEAERTYHSLAPELSKNLKIYHETTERFTKILGAHPRGSQEEKQAIAELRVVTREFAKNCEKLKRDDVEMLLVALEILLEVGGQDSRAVEDDALTMMAVVGTTMKASIHNELSPYADRFNRLASARLVPRRIVARPVLPSDIKPRARPRGSLLTDFPRGDIIFFLKLSPKHALIVTEREEFDMAVRDRRQ